MPKLFQERNSSSSSSSSSSNNANPPTQEELKPEELTHRNFESRDMDKLSQNEHGRYMPASKIIGHALVHRDNYGKFIAKQYTIPQGEAEDTPKVTILKDIKKVTKFNKEFLVANSSCGVPMIAKRKLTMETALNTDNAMQHELWRFSPKATYAYKGSTWWGGGENDPPMFNENISEDKLATLQANLGNAPGKIKHQVWKVHSPSVPLRDLETNRKPDQKTVMGGVSAHNAGCELYNNFKPHLHPVRKSTLQNNLDAKEFYRSSKNLGSNIKSQSRFEWLHLKGHNLTPIDEECQFANNLSAAPKRENTRMLPLERTARWHAINRRNVEIIGDVKFEQVPNHEILNKGTVQFTFTETNGDEVNTVRLTEYLYPFAKYPDNPKSTDVAQVAAVTHKTLTKEQPAHVSVVIDESNSYTNYSREERAINRARVRAEYERRSMNESLQKNSSNSTATSSSSISNSTMESTANTGVNTMPTTKSKHHKRSEQIEYLSEEQTLPTSIHFQNSVVEVFTTSLSKNYGSPWLGSYQTSGQGSGCIIEQEGEKFILTNAHVVENQVHLQIRFANDDTHYPAEAVVVGYQQDLALLKVADPEFNAKAIPVKFGKMVSIDQNVNVLGFPMGGDEISSTMGSVSRISTDMYVQNFEENLVAQTQAPINCGNSGGPVFSNNKLVGIAFQSIDEGDGLHYFIPMPVVKHFLTDFFTHGKLLGVPNIAFKAQNLQNKLLRESLGMPEGVTGLRVTSIDKLSSAHDKLQKGDIITEIDGHRISNDGKCKIEGIGDRMRYEYLFNRKQMGETVKFKVLRKDAKSDTLKKVSVDIELKYKKNETKVVPPYEYDKPPTFFLNSGAILQPITREFLASSEGKYLGRAIIPKHGFFSDIPKKYSDQQYVVLNTLLESDLNAGNEYTSSTPIKYINDVKIRNIQHALQVMESNTEHKHKIEFIDGEVIAIPNLTLDETIKLMKKHNIKSDRSEDLGENIFVRKAQEEHSDQDKGHTKHKKHKISKRKVIDSSEEEESDIEVKVKTRHVHKKPKPEVLETDESELDEDYTPSKARRKSPKSLNARVIKRKIVDKNDSDAEDIELGSCSSHGQSSQEYSSDDSFLANSDEDEMGNAISTQAKIQKQQEQSAVSSFLNFFRSNNSVKKAADEKNKYPKPNQLHHFEDMQSESEEDEVTTKSRKKRKLR